MLNILLITLDQFGGDSLSCVRHPTVRTPNLDRLAGDGVRLARHYAQSAPCSPGRASLYTGLYQMNHRAHVVGFIQVADTASARDFYERVVAWFKDPAGSLLTVTSGASPRWRALAPAAPPKLECRISAISSPTMSPFGEFLP